MATLTRRKVPIIRGVADLEAIGTDRMKALRYRTLNGAAVTVEAGMLLVHET